MNMKILAPALSLALLSGCAVYPFNHHSQNTAEQQQEQQQADQDKELQKQKEAELKQQREAEHQQKEEQLAAEKARDKREKSDYPGYRQQNSFWGWWGPWNGGYYFPAYYSGFAGSLHSEFSSDDDSTHPETEPSLNQ
jgi:hypothetical protein